MIKITQAYSGIGRLQIAVTTEGLEWEPYVEIICITHGFVRYWVLNINRDSVGTWVKWNTVMHLQYWRSPAWTSPQRLCWDAKEQIGVCALIYIEPLATRICRQSFGIAAAFHQWEFESHQLLSILESPAMPTMAAILLFAVEDRAPLITYTWLFREKNGYNCFIFSRGRISLGFIRSGMTKRGNSCNCCLLRHLTVARMAAILKP